MYNSVCVVELPGEKNYAVVSPGRVVYGLKASKKELNDLISEEELGWEKRRFAKSTPENVCSVSLGIIPTLDCNLRCIYCYARGGDTKEIISLETAEAAIRNAAKYTNDKTLKLYLVGGGEPLLYFDLVKQIVDYAKSIYQKVELDVVTNGTFDEEVLDWLVNNKVDIKVSYDGVMHSNQRPFENGSYSTLIVEETVKKLIGRGASVIVQCIITNLGIHTMHETIEKFISLGVNAAKFEPALSSAVSRAKENIEPDPKRYAEALLSAVSYVSDQGYNLTIDTGFFAEPSGEHYCGMPTNNRVVTPHGSITSCVEVARLGDPYAGTIMIGHVESDNMVINSSKRRDLLKYHYVNQLGGCRDCNLRLICHGGCPMANIWKGGLPIRKSDFICTVEHTLLPRLLLMIAEDPKVASVVMEDATIDRF